MVKNIQLASSIAQAESIASHVLLLLIRDLGITEISTVQVRFDDLNKISDNRLDEIVCALSEFNADQILTLSGIDLTDIEGG